MRRRLPLYLLLSVPLAMTLACAGCYVRPYGYYHAGLYVEAPPTEFGYEPLLYDGYVVYYTDASLPFYWVNGVVVYVPVGYQEVYVEHYNHHRAAFAEWDAQRGRQYRGQRYQLREG